MARMMIGAVGLAVLWLLMSGLWDKPLILAFGVVSVFLAMLIGRRMDHADGETLQYAFRPFGMLKYSLWLLLEIAESNIAVAKIILSGQSPDRQKLFMAPVSCSTDLTQVVFANSITLTPGTITVETEQDQFIVHALDFGDGDMEALAEMDARVASIEKNRAA